jgi:transposase
MRLGREERQELVGYLSGEGLSVRAIAPIVGADPATVSRDRSRVADATPAPAPTSSGSATIATREGVVIAEQTRTNVTGLDGKTYHRPEPKKPQRRALTDSARDAGWDIRKAVERLERIREDDRFSRNKEELAELLRGHLVYVIETCQGLLDDINQSKES